MNVESKKTYDWLEHAILMTCKKVFPTEPALRVGSVSPRLNRISPHQEYDFTLISPDTELQLILRLHYGMFSIWKGTEELKTSKEYAATRHAYQNGCPVPFPYSFSPSQQPFGHPYMILDAGDGQRWWEYEDSLSSIQEVTVDSLADCLAQLHQSIPARHPLIPKIEPEMIVKKIWSRVMPLGSDELKTCFQGCYRQLKNQKPIAPVFYMEVLNWIIYYCLMEKYGRC